MPVNVERRDDGVAVVRIEGPRLNALSTTLLIELADTVSELSGDVPGAVVLWGGERTFAAGADIGEFGDSAQANVVAATFASALDGLAGLGCVTIAAVTGYALGGGCELALACDFRYSADHAVLGFPEVTLGLMPGGGGTQRLPMLVGLAAARELLLTGRRVGAAEALTLKLVDQVLPANSLLEVACKAAGEFAAGPRVAQDFIKRSLAITGAEGMATERQLFAEVFDTDDARNGIASFLQDGPGKARFVGK